MLCCLSRFLLLLLLFVFSASSYTQAYHTFSVSDGTERWIGRRSLLTFKESPRGTNVTFECSPSGPCVACLYSEKNDEKYRCSETGYRIPLKCVEIKDRSTDANKKKSQKSRSMLAMAREDPKSNALATDATKFTVSMAHRNLLHDSSSSKGTSEVYITYRSCIPAVSEEKLSVLGFEGVVLFLLLISGSAVYFKRKRSGSAAGRIQPNSRF